MIIMIIAKVMMMIMVITAIFKIIMLMVIKTTKIIVTMVSHEELSEVISPDIREPALKENSSSYDFQ